MSVHVDIGGQSETQTWQEYSNCLGVDPDLFFPERGAATKEAKAAAKAAKAKPVLVRTGKGQRTATGHPELRNLPWFNDLSEAVDSLLDGNLHT